MMEFQPKSELKSVLTPEQKDYWAFLLERKKELEQKAIEKGYDKLTSQELLEMKEFVLAYKDFVRNKAISEKSFNATVEEFETEIKLGEKLKYWREFYKKNGVDWVSLPEKIKLNHLQMVEMKRLVDMGFNNLMIIPKDIVGRPEIKDGIIVKPAEHYEELYEIMKPGHNEIRVTPHYIKEGGLGGAWDKTTEMRIVLSKEAQELKDDELLGKTIGKSVEDLNDSETGLFAETKTRGFAESEYLILQREYFDRTGKHLDEMLWTCLSGSERPVSMRVSNAHWNPNFYPQLCLGSFPSGRLMRHLGCRLAGSFEII